MRRCQSTTELESRPPKLSPCWLPAGLVGDVAVKGTGHRLRKDAALQGLSAAALRLALASAGAEELRVVHEMREQSATSSGAAPCQQPPTPRLQQQLPAQPAAAQSGQELLAGRFRSATLGAAAAAAAASDDNPVRAALNRHFPSASSSGGSAAARASRTLSSDDLSGGAAASEPPLQRRASDASIVDRAGGDRGSVASAAADAEAALSAWPNRRDRRGGRSASSGGGSASAFSSARSDAMSASAAGSSCFMSADGPASGRSSLDRASSHGRLSMDRGSSGGCGGRASLDGGRPASDSDRSEGTTCSAPLRADSAPCARGLAAGGSAADSAFGGAVPRTSSASGYDSSNHGSLGGRGSLSRRDAALMDTDCCGDSGCAALLVRRGSSAASASGNDGSVPCSPGSARSMPLPLSSQPASPSGASGAVGNGDGEAFASLLRRQSGNTAENPRKWACLSDGQAAMQLFWRLNHARQTVDFVRRQRSAFGRLNKARMTIPEALAQLDMLREFEAPLLGDGDGSAAAARDIGLAEHAFQTAEACRLAHPEAEWLHLAGLLHGLGKLLAHPTFGAEAQWAVCGESFPVGCQHSPNITASEFFSVNPDRRRRMYNTPTGMYTCGCGLANVLMSWSGCEYLHMALAANAGTALPPPTLWLLRHAKFRTLAVGDYGQLLDGFDRSMLPWLAEFQKLAVYKRRELPGRLEGEALQQHYATLLAKYLPPGPLRW